MLRSLRRLAVLSSKSLRISNELMSKVHLSSAAENIRTNVSRNSKRKPLINQQLKYYSIYFYKLASDYFKSGLGYSQLKEDSLFNENCQATLKFVLENQSKNQIQDKLSILRSLQTVGVPSDDELIRGLIENLAADLDKLTVEKALKVLMNQVQFQESDAQKQFIKSLVDFTESKQREILTMDTILMIYNERIAHLFSKSFLERIDKEAIMINKGSNNHPLRADEITWLLHKLSLTKRRPKPFIQFLVRTLLEKEIDKLDFNKVVSLLNSLANLNYLSLELMSKLDTFQVENQFFLNINRFDFNQLMKSYIKLRYEPTDLFNSLVDNIEILNDRLGPKACMSLISTMAFFNYSKVKVSSLLNKPLFKAIDPDLITGQVLHIDYTWALAFYDHLQKAPLDLFTSESYAKILDNKHFFYLRPRFQLLYQYCKLNLGLDIKLPDHDQENVRLVAPRDEGGVAKFPVDNFMFNLKREHVLFDVQSELGFKFDMVFVCDKDLKTVPIQSLEQARQLCNSSNKLFCVCNLGSKEVILNTGKVIGEIEMLRKVGSQLDYRVLLINPHEFQDLKTVGAVRKFNTLITDSFT